MNAYEVLMKITTILLVLITNCSGTGTLVDGRLDNIYQEFLDDTRKHNLRIDNVMYIGGVDNMLDTVNVLDAIISDESFEDFLEQIQSVIGLCNYSYSAKGFSSVYVREDYIVNGGIKLKQLLYHELGHCMLKLDHTDTEIDILSEYEAEIDEKYWDFYLDRFYKYAEMSQKKAKNE
jgi:hypothetical protein